MLDGMSWAHIVYPREELITKGMVCATLVKCYSFIWSFNPCKIVCLDSQIQSKGTIYSQVAISTLNGHLIEGEEKFRVDLDKQSSNVTLSLSSFTRGSGFLGRLAMPLIRPMQSYFFEDVIESVRSNMLEVT